ncbi:MAG TPA: LysM domain-containing protein [Solirubrobacteraceae bacterium]
MPRPPQKPAARLISWLAGLQALPNPRDGVPDPKARSRPGFGSRVDYRGLRLTREARAALAGALVGLMFLSFVVIRLDPSGSSGGGGGLTAVSAKTLPTVWVVHSGQTYELISERTGVSVTALEDLNPYVDPGTLQVGERIRLSAKPAHGQ